MIGTWQREEGLTVISVNQIIPKRLHLASILIGIATIQANRDTYATQEAYEIHLEEFVSARRLFTDAEIKSIGEVEPILTPACKT